MQVSGALLGLALLSGVALAMVVVRHTVDAGSGGAALRFGDLVSLESAVRPGSMLTRCPAGDRGEKRWGDLRHVYGAPFRLQPGPSVNASFRVYGQHRYGQYPGSPIHSSDYVYFEAEGQTVTLNFDVAWPPMLDLGRSGAAFPAFQILKAHPVDLAWAEGGRGRAPLSGDDPVHLDTRAGEVLCKGDQVFIRHQDMYYGSPLEGRGHLGQWFYLQGQRDDRVGMWHHFPGYSGLGQDLSTDILMWLPDDPNATANRFTIRGAEGSS